MRTRKVAVNILPLGSNPPGFETIPSIHVPGHWLRPEAAPAAARFDGDAQAVLGIFKGDYLLVERKREPTTGDIVVLAHPIGPLVLVRYMEAGTEVVLVPGSLNVPGPIKVRKRDLRIWGVVRGVIRMADSSVLQRPEPKRNG